MKSLTYPTGLLLALLVHATATAQNRFVPNYDEAAIPAYELPAALVSSDGSTVTTRAMWEASRRPEVLDFFAAEVYGRSPAACEIQHKVVSEKSDVINGKAIRREVDVTMLTGSRGTTMRLLIYTPKSSSKVPVFIGLNFQGNHTIDAAKDISITKNWVRNRGEVKNNQATESTRGTAAGGRWPIETIVDRGYGLVTIYYGDIDPDFADGFQNGIHPQFEQQMTSIPQGERWGSIAAWAYGLSRAVDYLEQDDAIDATRVAVIGHSRLGKTSLWAGATDPRFKLVISNNSGCGGAALSRRAIGETVERINTSFPHWFCDNYCKYNKNENACPVDQHMLIGLIAPRAVYVASATGDPWADPRGEFLSCVYADPIFRLLGTSGMGGSTPPAAFPTAESPINSGQVGYHLRTGKHDVTDYDWAQYLDFADRHVK
ncbi:MAG: acetylxylan esterase [Saprospirales bacterium TMED214]|nr:MAG: acetylxylan esterase [Saprospirales bacterium TMED214]